MFHKRLALNFRFHLNSLLIAIGLGVGAVMLPPSFGQAIPVAASVGPNLQDVLSAGMRLESERRWSEALSHYEEALHLHPNDNRLRERFRVARIHLDVSRRYSDESFRKVSSQLGPREAWGLCLEVLQKIDSHFVESPDWSSLVINGIETCEVALRHEAFLDRGIDEFEIQRFSEAARALAAARPVSDRLAVAGLVWQIAQAAHRNTHVDVAIAALEQLCGISNGLDDYSAFLTSSQLGEVYSQIEGQFVGLGIELKSDDGALLVIKVISGSPAHHAGVMANDRIVEVDGKPMADVNADKAANLLQGPEGSTVTLTIDRGGQHAGKMKVTRRHVDIASVEEQRLLDTGHGIAYLRISSFQKSTVSEMETSLWDLHRQGMQYLIVDLRGNPGGLLSAAVDLVDKFVSRGVIVSTRGRDHHEDYNYMAKLEGTWRVPLIVLIDHDSASASEIFAGAIKDHGRGLIVGQKSFGKGSVQGIFQLRQGGTGIRLTTAKFFSPRQTPISKLGISPDLEVVAALKPADEKDAVRRQDVMSDATIQAALQAARRSLARRN